VSFNATVNERIDKELGPNTGLIAALAAGNPALKFSYDHFKAFYDFILGTLFAFHSGWQHRRWSTRLQELGEEGSSDSRNLHQSFLCIHLTLVGYQPQLLPTKALSDPPMRWQKYPYANHDTLKVVKSSVIVCFIVEHACRKKHPLWRRGSWVVMVIWWLR
jgi:hypothetical protein